MSNYIMDDEYNDNEDENNLNFIEGLPKKEFKNKINNEVTKFEIVRYVNESLSSIFGIVISSDNKYAFITRVDKLAVIENKLEREDYYTNKINARWDRKICKISYLKLQKLGLGLKDIKEIGAFLSIFKPVSIQYKYKELYGFNKGKEI